MYRFFFTCIILLVLFACSKETNKRWLVVQLLVKDNLSKLPLKARVEFQYNEPVLFGGSVTKTIKLGETDDKGWMFIEQHLSRKADNLKLNIYAKGYIYPTIENMPSAVEEHFNLKNGNLRHVYLDPLYFYHEQSVKNINCFNQQDSMWINESAYVFVGCVNSHYQLNGIPRYTKNPNLHYNLKIKRNGVVTYMQKDIVLPHKTTTYVDIEY